MAQGPTALKMDTLSNLRRVLSEIHKEIEVTMLAKFLDVEDRLKQIQIDGSDTNNRVCGTQSRIEHATSKDDIGQLAAMRKLLGVKLQHDTHTDVSRYKAVLAAEALQQRRGRRVGRALDAGALLGDPSYSGWLQSSTSSILILAGENFGASAQMQLSWLSMASVLTVDELRRNPLGPDGESCQALQFLCRPAVKATRDAHSTFDTVMQSLIYQLLQQNLESLHECAAEVEAARKSKAWQSADIEVALAAMANQVASLMAQLPADTDLTIVLDRPDQCGWKEDVVVNDVGLSRAMWTFIDLIKSPAVSHLRVKVLVVVDDLAGVRLAQAVQREKSRTVQCRVDWDQEGE